MLLVLRSKFKVQSLKSLRLRGAQVKPQSDNHTIRQSDNELDLSPLLSVDDMDVFLRTQFGEEVHLECVRKFRRRAERKIDVLVQHFRDVRTRDFHALREVRLRYAKLLHSEKDAPEKCGAYAVDGRHSLV